MTESFNTKLSRWMFNLFPAYRGSGGRVIYISESFSEVQVKIPLNWRTRNYVGTIFGGSIYGAVDPIYMIMLIKILGPDFVVWDKAAAIQFKRPGRSTLYASFVITGEELDYIKKILEKEPSVNRVYTVDLVDKKGTVHATIEKTIYIKKKKGSSQKRVPL